MYLEHLPQTIHHPAERATTLGYSKDGRRALMPGETLSGYERMQPFTIKNGYKMAKAYQNGLVIDSVAAEPAR